MRAALRLQTRSAQACSQNAQAPPRSDFSKKCLSSRSPELPGRVLPNLSEPLPLQVLPGDPVLLLQPLRTSPELRPSPRPFRGAGPNRTGPSWAARARPLTMASLFKKKTVDGEFRVGLVRPAVWRCSGQGSRAVPGGGPGSAPQVTMAASLRLPCLTWPVCLPDCAHPTHLFLFFSFPLLRDSEHSEEADHCWPSGVLRLGDLMNFLLVFPACWVAPSVETFHFLTSEREVR